MRILLDTAEWRAPKLNLQNVGAKLKRSMPRSLAVRAFIALLATRKLVMVMRRGHRPELLNVQQRTLAVAELKRLVPPPRPRELGGERIGTEAYERFLSVVARPLVQIWPRLPPKPKGLLHRQHRTCAPAHLRTSSPLHLCVSAPLPLCISRSGGPSVPR